MLFEVPITLTQMFTAAPWRALIERPLLYLVSNVGCRMVGWRIRRVQTYASSSVIYRAITTVNIYSEIFTHCAKRPEL